MAKINFANVAVVVLFFGLALVEAVKNGNWLEAGLFTALGLVSFWANFRRKT